MTGIVMVRMPRFPNEPPWPGRIISYDDYEDLYANTKKPDRPGKNVRVYYFS